MITDILGHIKMQVTILNKTGSTDLFVIKNKLRSIVGLDVIKALGLNFEGSSMKVSAITTADKAILKDLPKLSEASLGTFPNFTHNI